MAKTPETFMRLDDVRAATGLARSTLYRLIAEKRFPTPVKIGERSAAWRASEIAAWQAEKIAARDAKAAA